MQLSDLGRAVLLMFVGLSATSCSSSTSPDIKALDGAWTTGHACLALGLDLSWSRDKVSGTGNYRTDTGPVGCATPSILNSTGTVAVDADRLSATKIAGTMTFDTTKRANFTGTLVESGGGAHIDASVVTSDGSTVPVTIYEGLIP